MSAVARDAVSKVGTCANEGTNVVSPVDLHPVVVCEVNTLSLDDKRAAKTITDDSCRLVLFCRSRNMCLGC